MALKKSLEDLEYLIMAYEQGIKDTEEEISCAKKFNDGRYLGLNDIIVTYDNENKKYRYYEMPLFNFKGQSVSSSEAWFNNYLLGYWFMEVIYDFDEKVTKYTNNMKLFEFTDLINFKINKSRAILSEMDHFEEDNKLIIGSQIFISEDDITKKVDISFVENILKDLYKNLNELKEELDSGNVTEMFL